MDASNFEKLVASLTEQQREKTSLEVAIKRCDAEKKSHENALSTARHKVEAMERQIPEMKQEIGKQSALRYSMQSELEQQKNSSGTLRNNVVRMKTEVQELQELVSKEEADYGNLVRETEAKYALQLERLKAVVGKN